MQLSIPSLQELDGFSLYTTGSVRLRRELCVVSIISIAVIRPCECLRLLVCPDVVFGVLAAGCQWKRYVEVR